MSVGSGLCMGALITQSMLPSAVCQLSSVAQFCELMTLMRLLLLVMRL